MPAELSPCASGGQTVFRRPVVRVPWEAVLKGKGVQGGWTFFKKEILEVYKQTVPTCQKTSQRVCVASHQSPSGASPEGQRCPGRLVILQKGNLRCVGAGCHHVPKDELVYMVTVLWYGFAQYGSFSLYKMIHFLHHLFGHM